VHRDQEYNGKVREASLFYYQAVIDGATEVGIQINRDNVRRGARAQAKCNAMQCPHELRLHSTAVIRRLVKRKNIARNVM